MAGWVLGVQEFRDPRELKEPFLETVVWSQPVSLVVFESRRPSVSLKGWGGGSFPTLLPSYVL